MTTILHIDLDESGAGWERYAAVLSDDERDRAGRFRFDADRLRFAKCRATLRQELADRLGVGPEEITFRFGEHGKPFIDDQGSDIQFNVSHTRGAALIAIGHGAEIGVDIENPRRMSDLDGIARKVFTEREQTELFQLDETGRAKLFFRLWTAKEAFLKAVGSGLSLAPAKVEAHLPDDGSPLGWFQCREVLAAAALRCVEIPRQDECSAMLCAPESLCAVAQSGERDSPHIQNG